MLKINKDFKHINDDVEVILDELWENKSKGRFAEIHMSKTIMDIILIKIPNYNNTLTSIEQKRIKEVINDFNKFGLIYVTNLNNKYTIDFFDKFDNDFDIEFDELYIDVESGFSIVFLKTTNYLLMAIGDGSINDAIIISKRYEA